jgi:hypothetical protein
MKRFDPWCLVFPGLILGATLLPTVILGLAMLFN